MPSSYGDVKINSNSVFLKIIAGTPHDIRLLDPTPVETYKHQFGNKPVTCKGSMCDLCQNTDPKVNARKQRFIVNVYDHTTSKVQLLEYGSMIATQLQTIANSLSEEGMDIMDFDLKIEVSGSGMETKYKVIQRQKSKELPGDIKRLPIDAVPF
jgi:hypothetical protein